MKKLLIVVIFFANSPAVSAQFSRYIIKLKDKAGTPFSVSTPSQFLTQRSISRRARYNIGIDQTDLPITPRYIDSIRLAGNVNILNISKWLNQVCIFTTDAAALAKINSFSFVQVTAPVAARPQPAGAPVNKPVDATGIATPNTPATPQNPTDIYNYGLAYPQIHLHSGEFLHNLGFSGQGMQVAVMDAGFLKYKSLATFDSARNNNQILGTWDFVANEASVNEDNLHGTACFSTIAANQPGSFVGTSPKSSFYLFRTEDVSSEYPIEEQNWAAAAEKADSLGADAFSVSLGYNLFDNSSLSYTYANMDGNTTIIARAADLAAKKGILVVVAAGNTGNSAWKYITTPADADSVLAVGAVNTAKQVAGFSAYGPSADGQVKPDVAAVGQSTLVTDASSGTNTYGNGTSFACPIMAGIATCLWQAFPEVNNMAVIDALRRSADHYATPDDRSGYGIPDAKKAFVLLLKKLYTQQIKTAGNCTDNISFTVKKAAGMSMVIERKTFTDLSYTPVTTINFTGSFAGGNFNYTDDISAVAAGTNISYRLKMNIADTSFYMDSAIINNAQTCKAVTEKITIGPNPVNGNLYISIARNSLTNATVNFYAAGGQKLYTVSQKINGAQTLTIPMQQWARGIYFVTVYLDGQKEMVKKIIKD